MTHPMTDTTSAMREALAFKLFQSDWPHKSAMNWNGDGTKDNPGHAALKDRCFERYCTLADVSIAAITAPAQADIHATTDVVQIGRETTRIVNWHSPTPPRVDEKEMVELYKASVAKLSHEKPGSHPQDYALAFGRALMEKCK